MSRFVVLNLPESEHPVFNIWQTVVAGASTSTSFGGAEDDTRAGDAADALIWQVELEAENGSSDNTLDRAEVLLTAAGDGLDAVAPGLAGFVSQGGAPQVHFGGGTEPVLTAQSELADLLSTLEGTGGIQAFGVNESMAAGWRTAQAGFRDFAHQIAASMRRLAWIDTLVDGVTVAQTRVAWSGELDTYWHRQPEHWRAKWHFAALDRMLTTRARLLRMSGLVVHGATLLAQLPALIATPFGWPAALAAAWRFVDRVVEDYQLLYLGEKPWLPISKKMSAERYPSLSKSSRMPVR